MTVLDADAARLTRRSLAQRVVAHLRRDTPLLLLDLAVVMTAYLVVLVLRYDGRIPSPRWRSFWQFMPVVCAAHLCTNYAFGLYGQMWRYASVQEARRVVLAGSASLIVVGINTSLGGLGLWTFRGGSPFPLSVAVLGSAVALMGFGAIRFQSRLFAVRRRSLSRHRTRVLLVGAGSAGALVIKDIIDNPSLGLDPVGFVDDDPKKQGLSLRGARVLGSRAEIPPLISRLEIDQVLLTIPSATSDIVRDVAVLCEEAEVTLRVLPTVREIVNGKITARDIRDLRIEDLLGRQQVPVDLTAVRALLQGRRILITGAGGSIGSEISRQVATFEPASVIALDHDETHLHDLLMQLSDAPVVEAVLADIRDRSRIHDLLQGLRPDVVFHAAAHKHVPLLEKHPEEALMTNVIGTANVVDAAVAAGAERFVMISSDKAVRPASVMGATKWFAEMLVRSTHESGCACTAVRFGNVLGSRGSVIPTFLNQIAKGGPVTVTDPSMARYFMSVQEAVQLVLQAAAMSNGGEVLSLEMGEPMNILDLARRLIRLSGRVPERDIRIDIVGSRPGEKLLEELIDPDEEPVASEHPGISISRPPVPDPPALRRALRELESLASGGRSAELATRLKAIAQGRLSVETGDRA
jgi:FlaA1/EpsC-like NDP-sugar epimerase